MGKKLEVDLILFILALILYSFTRFYSLENFPVYFFTDEAYHPLKAEELAKNSLKDNQGNFFPLFFEVSAQRFRPILSVYPYVLTNQIFGKSVFTTRAVTAFFSILAAISLALIMKWIFKSKLWWITPLILAIIPSWFIHSRTGFETAVMASFYAIFLLFYLLYRFKNPMFIFPSVLFAAFAFYTYSNGQIIMSFLAILLFFSDLKYHLKNYRLIIPLLLFTLLLSYPYISFKKKHEGENFIHLRMINSYLTQPLSLQEKLTRFGKTYLEGLSPVYWFNPNSPELQRHRMNGYGHINRELYPLILIGMGLCLWRIRQSKYRTVLLALLAAPLGSALAEIGITRVLAVVIPATILATLGLSIFLKCIIHVILNLFQDLHRVKRVSLILFSLLIFSIFSISSLNILRQTIVNGPLWFRDYGLYGMQWGAKQLFTDTIPKYLVKDPAVKIMVSPVWANGTELFLRFFLKSGQQKRVLMRNPDYYSFDKRELDENTLLIMPANEYQKTVTDPKFNILNTESVIPYPDDSPGFYFVRLSYSDKADEIFRKEKEERKKPVEEELIIDGEKVNVTHSRLDIGPLKNLVDGDTFTLIRGMEANPLVLEFHFPKPKKIRGLSLDLGSMADFTVKIAVNCHPELAPQRHPELVSGSNCQKSYSQTFRNLPPDPHIEIKFDQKELVSNIVVEIKNNLAGDPANIHIRELSFN